MKKLYINNRRYVNLARILIVVIQLATISVITYLNLEQSQNSVYNGIILAIIGFGLILLLSKSRFLYRTLERTNNATLTLYNNFFGFKVNSSTISLDSVYEIQTSQDQKNYFIIELQLLNGKSFQLGKFAVKSQLLQIEQLAKELVKK